MCGQLQYQFKACGHTVGTTQTKPCQLAVQNSKHCEDDDGPPVIEPQEGKCSACEDRASQASRVESWRSKLAPSVVSSQDDSQSEDSGSDTEVEDRDKRSKATASSRVTGSSHPSKVSSRASSQAKHSQAGSHRSSNHPGSSKRAPSIVASSVYSDDQSRVESKVSSKSGAHSEQTASHAGSRATASSARWSNKDKSVLSHEDAHSKASSQQSKSVHSQASSHQSKSTQSQASSQHSKSTQSQATQVTQARSQQSVSQQSVAPSKRSSIRSGKSAPSPLKYEFKDDDDDEDDDDGTATVTTHQSRSTHRPRQADGKSEMTKDSSSTKSSGTNAKNVRLPDSRDSASPAESSNAASRRSASTRSTARNAENVRLPESRDSASRAESARSASAMSGSTKKSGVGAENVGLPPSRRSSSAQSHRSSQRQPSNAHSQATTQAASSVAESSRAASQRQSSAPSSSHRSGSAAESSHAASQRQNPAPSSSHRPGSAAGSARDSKQRGSSIARSQSTSHRSGSDAGSESTVKAKHPSLARSKTVSEKSATKRPEPVPSQRQQNEQELPLRSPSSNRQPPIANWLDNISIDQPAPSPRSLRSPSPNPNSPSPKPGLGQRIRSFLDKRRNKADNAEQWSAQPIDDEELAASFAEVVATEQRVYDREIEQALAQSRDHPQPFDAEDDEMMRVAIMASNRHYIAQLKMKHDLEPEVRIKYIDCGHSRVVRGDEAMEYGDNPPATIRQPGTCDECATNRQRDRRQYYQPTESPSYPPSRQLPRPVFDSRPPSRHDLSTIEERSESSRAPTRALPAHEALRNRESEEANRRRIVEERYGDDDDARTDMTSESRDLWNAIRQGKAVGDQKGGSSYSGKGKGKAT